MENAIDALKMAAAILIFIIAIASSFSLFGTAKKTADSIISMKDKQAYLEAAELDNGILYTSSEAISGGKISGITTNGDRIVGTEDVFSTIYRYAKEKYGVTIVEDGTVLVRFDSNTENFMSQYDSYQEIDVEKYIKELNKNTYNVYIGEELFKYTNKETNTLKEIFGDSNAVWYANEAEIQKRINADISGSEYIFNEKTYEGKKLLNKLKDAQIIEVINEIDQSKYLIETNEEGENIETNLLQAYKMPTVEIIYIIY